MTSGKRNLLIAIIIILVVVGGMYSFLKGTYNQFVVLDEAVKSSWAQVENQLQRRYDLIPNLVETVRGYAKQEKDVLVEVTNARARVGGAATVPDKIAANNELSSALSRLLVVVERYPDLKSNQNFLRLQDELAGTENRIAVERRRYNEAVQTYNVAIRSFPANLLAGTFGFGKAAFFEAPAAPRRPLKSCSEAFSPFDANAKMKQSWKTWTDTSSGIFLPREDEVSRQRRHRPLCGRTTSDGQNRFVCAVMRCSRWVGQRCSSASRWAFRPAAMCCDKDG
jgi:LemA protein